MKYLGLLRHAKSDWSLGLEDHDRPLNKRGQRSAEAIGYWLARKGLSPDEILCSTSKRTRPAGNASTSRQTRPCSVNLKALESRLSSTWRRRTEAVDTGMGYHYAASAGLVAQEADPMDANSFGTNAA